MKFFFFFVFYYKTMCLSIQLSGNKIFCVRKTFGEYKYLYINIILASFFLNTIANDEFFKVFTNTHLYIYAHHSWHVVESLCLSLNKNCCICPAFRLVLITQENQLPTGKKPNAPI